MTSAISVLTLLISSTPPTTGNRMPTGWSPLTRKKARSCVFSTAGCLSSSRTPRSESDGLRDGGNGEGGANQKAELGSVEADAVGLVEERRFGVGELVHVGEQHDGGTVGRYGREAHHLLKPILLSAKLALEPLVLGLH